MISAAGFNVFGPAPVTMSAHIPASRAPPRASTVADLPPPRLAAAQGSGGGNWPDRRAGQLHRLRVRHRRRHWHHLRCLQDGENLCHRHEGRDRAACGDVRCGVRHLRLRSGHLRQCVRPEQAPKQGRGCQRSRRGRKRCASPLGPSAALPVRARLQPYQARLRPQLPLPHTSVSPNVGAPNERPLKRASPPSCKLLVCFCRRRRPSDGTRVPVRQVSRPSLLGAPSSVLSCSGG